LFLGSSFTGCDFGFGSGFLGSGFGFTLGGAMCCGQTLGFANSSGFGRTQVLTQGSQIVAQNLYLCTHGSDTGLGSGGQFAFGRSALSLELGCSSFNLLLLRFELGFYCSHRLVGGGGGLLFQFYLVINSGLNCRLGCLT